MSSFALKIFAIIFMFIDHIGYVFFPAQNLFRIIGRLAFPIFSFQIGIGFKHTKNKEKHILLLLLFAIFSQIPFFLMCNLHAISYTLNILFTFIFALIIIYCNDNIKSYFIRIPLIVILILLTFYIKVDYGILGILLTVFLYYFSHNKYVTFIILTSFVILHYIINNSILQLYSLFSIIFIWLFNGQKGMDVKWLFYIFYPLHMLLIFVVYKLFS
ncbi:MAG: conjugal transfer protein TraX [Clostridia bacterium]|nr:conjugal transfer protein TraX [Clostridia bacterium]